ncbi:uncharacterized protein LOC123554685 isoform X2 [Mercenaria mercenaria]|uniref:uncharacterized protein LOC123554685 isoform X2 n=1 Tax=Mercenaria mercenaria TaxID=6596 RepID=UPI00234F24D1|nr:uncharacterized protein LOC123554685 isoform X2 [Mercenaria mercenaria]
MAEVNIIEHTESTVSSVRSTVSTASSGYAIISVPGKQREDVRTVYPAEPPPDYDDPPRKENILPKYADKRPPSPRQDYESRCPLLPQDPRKSEVLRRHAGNTQASPIKEHESSVPLLTEETVYKNDSQQQQTIVRISSKSRDLNIEIVSNPALSPSPTAADTSFVYSPSETGRSNITQSPSSTAADTTSFLYETSKRREKILLIVLFVLLVALVITALNFTVCIGDFTSAC